MRSRCDDMRKKGGEGGEGGEEEGSVTKKRLVTIGGSEGNILSTNLHTTTVSCTHFSICWPV